MGDLIGVLRDEHGNMVKLLRILERQVEIFEAGGTPDYDLIDNILKYSLNFPEFVHHPKEDMIYKRLRRRDPAAVQTFADLEKEHRELSRLTLRLTTAIREILAEVELPREWVVQVARDYIDFSRRHMEMEEAEFLPAAEKALTAKDWAEIETAASGRANGLFGPTVEAPYLRLYDAIVRLA